MPNRDASHIAAILALWLGAGCGEAAAQVLYKWVDADGKTQYSDRPPKNSSGPVTRMEPDEQPPAPLRVIPKPVAKTVPRADEIVSPANDAAAQRRETRRKLEAELNAARAKLASARAALDAGAPQDDERQVIQQKVEKGKAPGAGSASSGGMQGSGGMHGGAKRSNCVTVKGNDGKTITTCPTLVPNDAYYERVKTQEDAVKAAEEELAAAEQAYRRGAD